VIAIEKDRKLYEKLKEKFSGNQKVEIKHGDFLNWHLPREEEYKIFSNIPFNLTADIVTKITATFNPPKDAYLIIQEEAAKKFAGLPYGKERQYSLLLKPWFEFKILYHFRNTDFYPIPQVRVVLLQIKKREEPLIEEEQAKLYRDFIVYGFNQWKPPS
jgi:23S rRNA (adenine-N6)-dimethyltransferase